MAMFLKKSLIQMLVEGRGNLVEMTFGRKYGLIFGGALVLAGVVVATVVFPFWNLIRDDVYEDVVILTNDNGVCFVETNDNIPKKISDCNKSPGDRVTIKFGEGLAWAAIVEP